MGSYVTAREVEEGEEEVEGRGGLKICDYSVYTGYCDFLKKIAHSYKGHDSRHCHYAFGKKMHCYEGHNSRHCALSIWKTIRKSEKENY